MSIRLLSASHLTERLALGLVSEREQAFYLAAGFILWLLPTYLLVIPAPNAYAWLVPLGLWFYELLLLFLVYVFGVLYCLGKCQVEPRKNFLVDFSCLYAPISLVTLVIVWGIFHIYASLIPWWVQKLTFEDQPWWLGLFYSERFLDLMRFLAMVAVNFFVFIRLGTYMERASKLRLSANPRLQSDAAQAPRA